MDLMEFAVVVNARIDSIRKILGAKAQEYAFGDRLSNFKRAAAMLENKPEEALLGMMAKHWVSVMDMIDNLGNREFSLETWNEKIGDSINYLILLEALIIERKTKEELDELGRVFPGDVQNRGEEVEVPVAPNRGCSHAEQQDIGHGVQRPCERDSALRTRPLPERYKSGSPRVSKLDD